MWLTEYFRTQTNIDFGKLKETKEIKILVIVGINSSQESPKIFSL